MKLLGRLVLFTIAMLVLGPADINAQVAVPNSTVFSCLEKGIHQVHIENYDKALQIFRQFIDSHSRHPMGYFLTAVVYHAMMRNYRFSAYETEFENYLDTAIKTGKSAVRVNRQDAMSYYCLGGAYGYRGLHHVRKRRWLRAFFDGMKGISNLKKALSKDPKLYDVYYGLGTYHYWRGAKSTIFRLIPIIRGDRERGINEIRIAINNGTHTRIEGRYALTAIYWEEKDYGKAESVNQVLFERFPENPSCLYMRARLLEQREKWKEAKDTVQRLLKRVSAFKHKSIGYQVECLYRIAYYHYKLGKPDQALRYCRRALDLAPGYDPSKEMEGPIEDFMEIVIEAEQLYEDILEGRSGN